MFVFNRLFSKKICRTVLVATVVAALIARGIIPVGYMPDSAKPAHQPLAMTICNGMGPMAMPVTPDNNSDGHKLQDHAPCPFGVNAVFAFAVPDFGFATLFIAFVGGSLLALAATVPPMVLWGRKRRKTITAENQQLNKG